VGKSTFSLIFGVIICCVSQSRGVDNPGHSDIESGKVFLDSNLELWEDCLNKAPSELGKMVTTNPQKSSTEYWAKNDCYLERYLPKSGQNLFSFANSEYRGAVRIINNKATLEDFGPRLALDFTPSPFNFTSLVGGNLTIPGLYREGILQIESYEKDQQVTIVLESVDAAKSNGVMRLKLVFDPEHLPLPKTKTVWVKDQTGDAESTSEILKFESVRGYWLPVERQSRTIFKGKAQTKSNYLISYTPEIAMETDQCYLEYYGLAKPDQQLLASFGRSRTSTMIWIALGAITIGVFLLVFAWNRRKGR
jgi:hypothetical protein